MGDTIPSAGPLGPTTATHRAAALKRRARWPTVALGLAALLMVISTLLPYWCLTLHSPDHPAGLRVDAYLGHLGGDVAAVEGLNREIGMRPLSETAELERSLSVTAMVVIALLVVAATYVRNRWAALLALPAVLFPATFLADLHYWLQRLGDDVDRAAPLVGVVPPFAPPLFGRGEVGPFTTLAAPGAGLMVSVVASLLILIGLWLHWRAYGRVAVRSTLSWR
jgi:copper chaperone NosL